MKPLNLLDEMINATDHALKQLNHLNHPHDTATKANTNPPNFKVNPKLGEGKATQDELKYRQDLQDLIKKYSEEVQDVEDSEIHKLTENFIKEGQPIAEAFINKIFDKNAEAIIKKLKKLGIKKKSPKDSEVKKALINWQLFAIEKMGIELELGIMNERLGKKYFEAAYGSPKTAK